jgi:hypothetical protein
MWEPRRLTALWASTACYRDSFTFLPLHCHMPSGWVSMPRFRDLGRANFVVAPLIISTTLHFRPASCLEISQRRWVRHSIRLQPTCLMQDTWCRVCLGRTVSFRFCTQTLGETPQTGIIQTRTNNLQLYFLRFWSVISKYRIRPFVKEDASRWHGAVTLTLVTTGRIFCHDAVWIYVHEL